MNILPGGSVYANMLMLAFSSANYCEVKPQCGCTIFLLLYQICIPITSDAMMLIAVTK